jgi:hypothetical protein
MLASWLDGDLDSVDQQCDRILSRIDETGVFRNQEALLTRLLQPARHDGPPVRNKGIKLVDSAARRSGLGPTDLFSNSPN